MEKERIKIQFAVLIAAVVLFAFLGAPALRYDRARKPVVAPAVAVEVKGEVAKPGLYILDGRGATVGAAAQKAGCGLKIAEPLVRVGLVPGQSLEIVRGKTGAAIKLGRMDGAALLAFGLKLDLNCAPLGDLLLVPHLRPAIAAAIIKRRGQKSWASVDDLVEIREVGPKTVQKLRDYLEVSAGEVCRANGDVNK